MDTNDVASVLDDPIGRRGVMVGLASVVATPAAAAVVIAPASAEDTRQMRQAIALAAQADFPFGTVIVRDGATIATGFNQGKRLRDPTAHGEMMAIRRCLADRGPEALRGATLYTSGEPCAMCMGAIVWCGITRVVYGASIVQLSAAIGQIMVPCSEIADKTNFVKIEVTGGVLADEAMRLFDRPQKK